MLAFFTSVVSIMPIIFLIIIGYLMQKFGWFENSFSNNISKLIMNVALPASVFVSVLKYLTVEVLIDLSNGFIYTVLAVIFCFVTGYILSKLLKVRVGRRGAFINMFAISNTIFIGLPLNMALFGEKGLPYFLIYYITNTIATWTIGAILIANDTTEKKVSSKIQWKKLIPIPFTGFIFGTIFLIFKIPVPTTINSTLTYLGNMVTPLSLLYIGIISAKSDFKSVKFDRDTVVGLLGRFLIAPLIMYLVAKLVGILGMGISGMEYQIYMVQSSTAGAAVTPILVNEAKGDVEYATGIITISMLICIFVVPLIATIVM